jgi:Na+/H+ antiporter NhaC
MEHGFLSLLPPILAIVLAITTRNVVISLFIGIFAGQVILNDFSVISAFIATFDGIVALFSESWITKTLIFALLVGSILRLIVYSGGVAGFVAFLTQKQQRIKSKKGALLLAYTIGLVIFIESSITALVAGAVARPLTDRFGASREKLAYVCDSTSAPVCSLIPLNAWGALLIGIILEQINAGVITGNATSLFFQSIPYNFYAILTLIFVLYIILSEKDFATMKQVEAKAVPINTEAEEQKGNLWHMILPLAVLIITMPIALYYSGKGDMLAGSGSTSVFYAVIVSLLFSFFYYWIGRVMSVKKWFDQVYKGASDMLPIVVILILAFSIGQVTKSLDTGAYLADLASDNLPMVLIPMVVFILTAIIAFSTGTSWGTFSIMLPIAITFSVASSEAMGFLIINSDYLVLVIAAVVSGGIFGDHCSPISDTTIIASMASQCDHISHVNTQLPYALVTGVVSAFLFLIAGIILV